MSRKSNPLPLSSHLCFAFYSMSHAFSRAYRQLLEPLGLTCPQYIVLLVLWERHELTVREIGEKLFLGTLTPLLKRLESLGHVHRIRDKGDERQVRIVLTDTGRSLGSQAEDIPTQLGCMLGLRSDELHALNRTISRLRGRLHEAVPPSSKS